MFVFKKRLGEHAIIDSKTEAIVIILSLEIKVKYDFKCHVLDLLTANSIEFLFQI